MRLKTGIIIVLAAVAFSIVSYFTVDNWVKSAISLSASADGPQVAFWHGITEMGNSLWMGIIVISIWITAVGRQLTHHRKGISWGGALVSWVTIRKNAEMVFWAVALPGIFVLVVKGIVGRARPYMVDAGNMYFQPFAFKSDFSSWPSGHTTTAFGFAVIVGLLFPRLRYILYPLAVLVGISRMVLDKHYLGDVVMGATIGTLGAILIYNWLRPKLV